MDFINAIRECLTGVPELNSASSSKPTSNLDVKQAPPTHSNDNEDAAAFLQILLAAEKPGEDLRAQLRTISTYGWYDSLARKILDGLAAALENGATISGAVKEVYDFVEAAVREFVEEHPVLAAIIATVIALAVLEILAPWVIEALGFGELGPIEGE
jgi:hypothetical protein